MSLRALALIGLLGLSLGLFASRAHADLDDDFGVLVKAARQGGSVQVLPTRLIERGMPKPLLLEQTVAQFGPRDCLRLILLSAPSVHFSLRFSIRQSAPLPSMASSVGLLEIEQCGRPHRHWFDAAIEMRSPRGIVYGMVISNPKASVAHARSLLPHRNPGPSAQNVPLGPKPSIEPLDARIARVVARGKRRGATLQRRRATRSAGNGNRQIFEAFEAGCHQIDVLGGFVDDNANALYDLDAEVRWADTGQSLGSDRKNNADGVVRFCIGKAGILQVRFAGALPGAVVTILHSAWPFPPGLPTYWGSNVRARMAEVLWQHQMIHLSTPPLVQSLGTHGRTQLPVQTVPGTCYLAALTVVAGHQRRVTLSVATGPEQPTDSVTGEQPGAALTFCTQEEEQVVVDIKASGTGQIWMLAAWPVGRMPLGGLFR